MINKTSPKSPLPQKGKKNKGLTLAEVLISIFIVAMGIGAVFSVYPSLFEGTDILARKTMAWEACRREIETLKNSAFTALLAATYDPETQAPPFPLTTFNTNIPNTIGVYYVERMRDSAGLLIDDLLRIEVVICLRAGRNRVIGEDSNFNASLDVGEDLNNDNRISSPISLHTLVLNRE